MTMSAQKRRDRRVAANLESPSGPRAMVKRPRGVRRRHARTAEHARAVADDALVAVEAAATAITSEVYTAAEALAAEARGTSDEDLDELNAHDVERLRKPMSARRSRSPSMPGRFCNTTVATAPTGRASRPAALYRDGKRMMIRRSQGKPPAPSRLIDALDRSGYSRQNAAQQGPAIELACRRSSPASRRACGLGRRHPSILHCATAPSHRNSGRSCASTSRTATFRACTRNGVLLRFGHDSRAARETKAADARPDSLEDPPSADRI